MRRSTWVIALSVLAAGGIFAAAAAYGSNSAQGSFDSDLREFMMRSDSSLLKIVRHQDGADDLRHLDEYSLGISDAALYKYISAADKAHKSRPSESAEPQEAFIEVVISRSETRTIMKELDIELLPQQAHTDYQIYGQELEISGRYYTLELMIPH